MTTPLRDMLSVRIRTSGPLTLADYMAEALLHPEHGYYATRDPFGAKGDFTTAPEISQMFGELLGLALAQYWLDLGAPNPFTLAELGPGRGTLMADVLRATKTVPDFHAAAQIILVEASPRLREIQAERLSGFDVIWAASASELPEAPLFLLANEFFDALPIRQFTRKGVLWAETKVGLDGQGTLTLEQGAAAPVATLTQRLEDVPEGGVVEICPAAPSIIAELSRRICLYGGLGLIVDYGDWKSLGDTFQAVQAHGYADPLAAPGAADLTAHVDFAALAEAARPAGLAYTTQGALLLALGIEARAARLSASHPQDAAQDPLLALQRLTNPAEMGSLFKALAIFPPRAALPPGFPASGSHA